MDDREAEKALAQRAKAALENVATIMAEARAMGVEVGWSAIAPGKRNQFEVQGFYVKKDLLA